MEFGPHLAIWAVIWYQSLQGAAVGSLASPQPNVPDLVVYPPTISYALRGTGAPCLYDSEGKGSLCLFWSGAWYRYWSCSFARVSSCWGDLCEKSLIGRLHWAIVAAIRSLRSVAATIALTRCKAPSFQIRSGWFLAGLFHERIRYD